MALAIPGSSAQAFSACQAALARIALAANAGADVAMKKKHPGFKAVQAKVAKSAGVTPERAAAIVAAGARKASPAAVRANPRLKKVSGVAPAPKRKGR